MGKFSSLFSCFGSKKHAAADNDVNGNGTGSSAITGRNGDGETNGKNRGDKRVTIKDDKSSLQTAQSSAPERGSVVGSRGSIYFDATDGANDDWQDSQSHDTFDETLQIDGQYFFTAKDDRTLSKETFEGIKMYPPLRTTECDPTPRSPVDISNMQTLLHTYQHDGDGESSKMISDEANVAAGRAGIALEHQARRLSMGEDVTAEYLGVSTNLLLKELNMSNVREKGFPGELTENELEAVKLFRSELETRDPIYKTIVRSLSEVEKEAYALCRFLRARKFDVEKVFELLDEAKENYKNASEFNFYADLEQALGFSRPIFLSQYPAVLSGNAKNGCPVMYLRLGQIQPEGIKCIVSFDKVDQFFWNDMMYTFPLVLKEGRRLNPNFVRTENVTVYDLKGVSRSQITSDTFEMIKVANKVMASFPETLHCLLIINAPSWFGLIWSMVKKLIDPRTASKIEVFTNAKSGDKRMRELIDESQVPIDYGGTGQSLAESASCGGSSGAKRSKMVVLNQLLSLTKRYSEKSHTFELEDGQQLMLAVYTRCKTGATAALFRADTEYLVTEIDIVGNKEDEPYSRTIGALVGPGSFKVTLKLKTDPGVFLLLGTAFRAGDVSGSVSVRQLQTKCL